MATVLHPWQILVAAMAGWITRQQDAAIEYLREENRVLKQQLGRKRRRLMNDSRIEIVRLPPRSPNLNAYAERFVRSIKDECLSRMIFFGERSLRKATREFATVR